MGEARILRRLTARQRTPRDASNGRHGMRRAWWWTVLAVAGTLALPLGGSARGKPSPAPTTGLKSVAFGVRPPDFAYDLGAGSTELSSQYGRPVVINFWATWCEPCREELPAFENLRREYGNRTTLITLSAEGTDIIRRFLDARSIDLPVAEDPERKVFDAYSIGPIPVTIVLDPNGTVSHVAVGELDWNELKAAVDAALALESTPSPETSAPR
jgi:thiol-disulfide isomerase/thioredoxin